MTYQHSASKTVSNDHSKLENLSKPGGKIDVNGESFPDAFAQTTYLGQVKQRLAPLLEPEEILEIIPSELQGIFLRRNGTVMELYCFDPKTKAISDIMSRIDICDPLFLHATCLQSAFLTACWHEEAPRNLYKAGFGGGRLAMLFRHCFPQIHIDASEFDPAIISLCESHFGHSLDSKFDVQAEDAMVDLERRDSKYDVIFIDTFSADGNHPGHMGSKAFMDLCRQRMSPEGVVASNLVTMDPHMQHKLDAMRTAFKHSFHWQLDSSNIVFASDTAPSLNTLKERAESLAKANGLSFPFAKHCEKITIL